MHRTDWSYYSFTCDHCSDEVRKPAGNEVVTLLRTGGVKAERWMVPAEAMEEHEGAPITYDDVLDFALWLDRVRPAGGDDRPPVPACPYADLLPSPLATPRVAACGGGSCSGRCCSSEPPWSRAARLEAVLRLGIALGRQLGVTVAQGREALSR